MVARHATPPITSKPDRFGFRPNHSIPIRAHMYAGTSTNPERKKATYGSDPRSEVLSDSP